jgi:O-antigen/teichoic acid export membrane protein
MQIKERLAAHQLAKNTIWNMVGQVLPLAIAIVSIPRLVHGLGTARFGILTLAWAVTGYFSVFDLGLGRALTKLVAERLGTPRAVQIPGLVNSGLAFMTLLGMLGAVILAALSKVLSISVFNVPAGSESETTAVIRILAASLPFVILTAGLRGVLEGYHRFPALNTVRIGVGAANYLVPLLLLPFTTNLAWLVAALFITRVIGTFIHFYLCRQELPTVALHHRFGNTEMKELLSFGGWMTVSNIVGPLLVYVDRFLIGILASMAAVTYYTTPYEMATKLWLVPAALTGVLFPAFSTSFVQDRARTLRLYHRGLRYMFLALFPVVLMATALAPLGFKIWLGNDFAVHSAPVFQWLVIAVFINCLANIPFAYLQALGRPDLTARFHLLELPIYGALLIWMIHLYGTTGAAVAWFARIVIDTALLFAAAHRKEATISAAELNLCFGALALLAIAAALSSRASMAAAYALVTSIIFLFAAWRWGLRSEERHSLLSRLGYESR